MKTQSEQAMMSSPTSRFDPKAALLAATWILFLLAALLIVIRCHVRRSLTKDWGSDDTSIVVGLVYDTSIAASNSDSLDTRSSCSSEQS